MSKSIVDVSAAKREISELQLDLKEKDQQNEHLMNILTGLNNKLSVYNDLKLDVETHKNLLADSENHREQLQRGMEQTADKINRDTA